MIVSSVPSEWLYTDKHDEANRYTTDTDGVGLHLLDCGSVHGCSYLVVVVCYCPSAYVCECVCECVCVCVCECERVRACVCVCERERDLKTSTMRRPRTQLGCCTTRGGEAHFYNFSL